MSQSTRIGSHNITPIGQYFLLANTNIVFSLSILSTPNNTLVMSWKNVLEKMIVPRQGSQSSFKITPETDENDSQCTGSIDAFKSQSRLIRLSVKRFPDNNYSPDILPIYIYIKLFKWDVIFGNYLKQSQVALTLAEFKAVQDNFENLDALIDRSLKTIVPEDDAVLPPVTKKQRVDDPEYIKRSHGFSADVLKPSVVIKFDMDN